jgi:hypothetical protein
MTVRTTSKSLKNVHAERNGHKRQRSAAGFEFFFGGNALGIENAT